MRVVNIHQAKTKLSELLVELEAKQEPIIICRYGHPIAEIIPLKKKKINPFILHKELQGVKIKYDPTAGASEDEWSNEDR